jgi:Sulfotransferase family
MINSLLTGLKNYQKPPIYIVALPRSGTTWVVSILNTVPGIKYFNEPFNIDHVPEALPHIRKYLRANDNDPEFAQFCQNAFTGKINNAFVKHQLCQPYKKMPWLPGRIVVKDVHSNLAVEWIDRHIVPMTVIMMRHPCAFALSWSSLYKSIDKNIEQFTSQPNLMEDYLQPFQHLFKDAQTLWEKLGLFWGASYYVMLSQQKKHPNWLVIQHEQLCVDPVAEYQKLFAQLDLPWTKPTQEVLDGSMTKDSGKPYVPQRITSQEPDKWKNKLESAQISAIQRFVQPFEINGYPAF